MYTKGTKITIGAILIITMALAAVVGIKLFHKQPLGEVAAPSPPVAAKKQPAPAKTVIDYDTLKINPNLQALTEKRLDKYGLKKGVDLIVKADEKVKIGDRTISMQDIINKSKRLRGEVVEQDLGSVGTSNSGGNSELGPEYGLYVVRPGDNIWNIHFQFLKEYFAHRNITLSPLADEPNRTGVSSGVGKLLKFSEKMVYIYNIMDQRIDDNVNLIEPLSKIVVYQMTDVFNLLNPITFEDVDRIEFDGETLWLPAAKEQ